jgi:hypothetical protein
MTPHEDSKMTRERTCAARRLYADPAPERSHPMSPFKILLAAALACVATTGSVSALSCMRPTVDSAYRLVVDREEGFVFAYGTLTRSGPDIPEPSGPEVEDARTDYSFPARFSGHLATRRGFTAPAEFEITVEVECLALWCGAEVLDDPTLYALRMDPDGYVLEATVCNEFAIRNPDTATLEEMMDLLT